MGGGDSSPGGRQAWAWAAAQRGPVSVGSTRAPRMPGLASRRRRSEDQLLGESLPHPPKHSPSGGKLGHRAESQGP